MKIRAGVSDGSTNESIVCSAPSRREELMVFFSVVYHDLLLKECREVVIASRRRNLFLASNVLGAILYFLIRIYTRSSHTNKIGTRTRKASASWPPSIVY